MTAHPTTGTDSWCTPAWLAEALCEFEIDPCSNPRSHVCATRQLMLELGSDGLKSSWVGSVFCNPPYSDVGPWAARLVEHDGPWVALLKLDPTTRWWATLMSAAPTVAPFRKRIKFETDRPGKGMTANFPSVLVYSAWRPPVALRPHLWLESYNEGPRAISCKGDGRQAVDEVIVTAGYERGDAMSERGGTVADMPEAPTL